MTKRCPHDDIQFCPLYVMAHEAGGYGCDDGKLEVDNGCAAARALDYGQAIARLWRDRPEVVKALANAESAWKSRQQRDRNMRLAGVH